MTDMQEYTNRITEYFLHKRGEGLILSPKNWMIIEKWEKIGIPLHIVIHGIDKTFKNLSAGDTQRKKIHYLAYCEPEILNLWKVYQKKGQKNINTKTSKSEKSKENQKKATEYVTSKILKLITQLAESLKKKSQSQEFCEAIAHIQLKKKLLNVLQDIRKSPQINIELIEKQLQNLDEQLVQSLLHAVHPYRIEALRLAAGKGIRNYKNQMETVAYQETVQTHFIELLRKEFGIHRLSLYQ